MTAVDASRSGITLTATRLAQAQAIAVELASVPRAVLTGDVIDVPGSPPVTAIGTAVTEPWPCPM